MLREQVLIEWNNLKAKMLHSWSTGKVVVYRPFTKPRRISEEWVNYSNQQQYDLGLFLKELGFNSLAPKVTALELVEAMKSYLRKLNQLSQTKNFDELKLSLQRFNPD